MNRRRSDNTKSSMFMFIALLLAFVTATAGGALHATYRNGQINAERKITEVEKRIESHRLAIQMLEVRRERLIDRYEIRDQLVHLDSDLVRVTHGVVEKVRPASDPMPVASRF